MKTFARDALYIPIKRVTDDQYEKVQTRFEKDVYKEEKTCEACDYFSERPCDVCDSCPNYEGKVTMHSIVKKANGKKYLRLPFGSKAKVERIFGDVTIVNKNKDVPMHRPIKFTGELRENQKTAVKKMIECEYGVLKSPPRSGKTVMGACFVSRIQQKTLILAAQKEWLDNFHETFVGSDTQKALTDIRHKRIGFPKTLEDFEKFDVSLVTYQKFLRPKGKKLLKKISKMFGIILVDEVQTAGAKEFAYILGQFHARYKIGLSGTPERKDSKEYIFYNLLGPVFYQNKVEQLRPRLECVVTNFGGKMPQQWTYIVNKIEKDPKRLRLIADTAIADVKAGHLVFIPLARVAVIKALAKAINQIRGKDIAAAFHGGVHKDLRKRIIQEARDYKIKIVVGNTRLISTGTNIPRASMLYQVSPSSNIPKAEQRFARVLTPHEGKPQPVFKYFLDDIDVVRSCLRKEHWHVVIPRFRPKMTGETKEILDHYFKNKKRPTGVNDYSGGYI